MQAKAYADAILGVNAQLAALQRDSAVTQAFKRASIAYQSDASGQYNQVGVDVLRNAYYLNGVLQPPLIESASQNGFIWTSDITNAAWTKTAGVTLAPAASCITGQVAQKWTTAVDTIKQIFQNSGTFVAGQSDVVFAILENVDAATSVIGIYDQTANVTRVSRTLTWSTHAVSGSGTGGAINLGNGRWLLWAAIAGVVDGNVRRGFCYPTGTATAGAFNVIVHHLQLEANAVAPSSVMVNGAAIVPRAADIDAMLSATATGYARVNGSFLSENFSVGMQVTPANFPDNTPRLITKVTDGTMDVAGPGAATGAVGGRSLTAIDPLPPNIVSIKNQADHNIEVREADDESQYPLIVVCVHSDATGPAQVWSGVQDADIDISSVLVMRGGSDAVKFRNTDYYLRAMKKATHQFLLSTNTRDTNGTRNGVVISKGKKTSFGHAQGSFMGGQVAGVLKTTYCLRDQAP